MEAANILELAHVTKDYGNNSGIYDINLQVFPGEVFGYLGPNGAGKTTTIRSILQFIRSSGDIYLFGQKLNRHNRALLSRVGYLPGEFGFYPDMNLGKLIRYFHALTGRVPDESKLEDLYHRLGITPRLLARPAHRFSHGEKQKVALCATLAHSPELLIMDEPTTGLDPLMQEEFYNIIREEKQKGTCIFFSSHILHEVELLCDRIGLLRKGRLLLVQGIDELRRTCFKKVRLLYPTREAASAVLERIGANGTLLGNGREVALTLDPSKSIDFLTTVTTGSSRPLDIDIRSETLDEIFLRLYGRGKENSGSETSG